MEDTGLNISLILRSSEIVLSTSITAMPLYAKHFSSFSAERTEKNILSPVGMSCVARKSRVYSPLQVELLLWTIGNGYPNSRGIFFFKSVHCMLKYIPPTEQGGRLSFQKRKGHNQMVWGKCVLIYKFYSILFNPTLCVLI